MAARLVAPTRGDLVAAVTVALVLIPQSLAYATIAGLEPVHGLYAAAAAPVFGAIIGSSPYLQTGPVAVTSLLTFGALAALAEPATREYAALAAVLAVVVGLVRLACGLLGAGPIAYLMSQPVVIAFTSAAAVLIMGTQVPSLVGVTVDDANPLVGAARALVSVGAWEPAATVIGLGSLALLLLGRRVSRFFPGALIAVVAATVWSRATGYDGRVVGDVVIDLRLPTGVAAGDVLALLVPGVVIALVGFAEPASIARTYATRDRRPWDANREFVGQGIANLASGVAGAFPVGGSFSRTALNRLSGARTRWSGAFTGLVVLAALPFVGLLSALPTAALAGLVIGAVVGLVDARAPLRYWRWSRPQFAVATLTAVSTLLLAPRVERGVLIGVVAALGVHLWREMRVDVPAEVADGVLHLHPSGVLYFGSAPAVERALTRQVAEHPDVHSLVVHVDQVGRLDLTGAMVLSGVLDEAVASGLDVAVEGASGHAGRLLPRVLSADVAVRGDG